MQKQGETGFTLLEALLMVIIIATVSAMVVPRFLLARSETERNTCRENMATINTQLEKCRMNGDPLPSADTFDDFLANTDHFPYGPPECPSGGVYELGENGRVVCKDKHGNILHGQL